MKRGTRVEARVEARVERNTASLLTAAAAEVGDEFARLAEHLPVDRILIEQSLEHLVLADELYEQFVRHESVANLGRVGTLLRPPPELADRKEPLLEVLGHKVPQVDMLEPEKPHRLTLQSPGELLELEEDRLERLFVRL